MIIKKFCYLLSALLLLLLLPMETFAREMDAGNPMETGPNSQQQNLLLIPSETDELGSITIKLEDSSKNLPKEGVSIAVVQVADVVNGEFVLKNEFESTKVNLNHIQTVSELEEASRKLESVETKQKALITTDHTGTASLSELPTGVYLIYAVDTAQYDKITSALVSIPTFDDMDGLMDYAIEIFPKHVPAPEKASIVKTGVNDHVIGYMGALVFSFAAAIFVMIVITKKAPKIKQKK